MRLNHIQKLTLAFGARDATFEAAEKLMSFDSASGDHGAKFGGGREGEGLCW